MITYRSGEQLGGQQRLSNTDEFIVVRTKDRKRLRADVLSKQARGVLAGLQRWQSYPDVGAEVLRQGTVGCDEALGVLKKEMDLAFAGRALANPVHGEPSVYTENLFIKLANGRGAAIDEVLRRVGLSPKTQPRSQSEGLLQPDRGPKNAYFVKAPFGTGQNVFEIADRLLRFSEVLYCYPEVLIRSNPKNLYSEQWHLRRTPIAGIAIDEHIAVEQAWKMTKGKKATKDGKVTIAIIDDGVDIDHPEFGGDGKIVASRNMYQDGDIDPRPRFPEDFHGTPCAGVACANGVSAFGVAPDALLMPIRAPSRHVNSNLQSEAIKWAADHGADVISCSWGPPDGPVGVPDDPRHDEVHPLPGHMKEAIDYAVTAGREGKGCLITFAAGNGAESVDNDGYASYNKVVAVAACNDDGKHCFYSDTGNAIWCSFPSGDSWHGRTTGIWTTDRMGSEGLNLGIDVEGDWDGNYTNSFTGTSSACAGAAGVAALIIAANPNLTWEAVKDIMGRCCEKIDPDGGGYVDGHSPKYGYGRLNAANAVALA